MDPCPDPTAFYEKKWSYAETKKLLETRLRSYSSTDPAWLSTDRHGSGMLHVLTVGEKAESLTWVLSTPFADTLRSERSLEGVSPPETLKSRLKSRRTWKHVVLS